jgi:hypothetical protein
LKKKTIVSLKEIFDGKEIIDDDTLEALKKKKLKLTDNLIFAELVIFSYTNLKSNLNKIDNKKVLKEVEEYLEIDVEEIRKIYSELGSGMELGDYYKKINLNKEIQKNRQTYEDLINTFFSIFEETD